MYVVVDDRDKVQTLLDRHPGEGKYDCQIRLYLPGGALTLLQGKLDEDSWLCLRDTEDSYPHMTVWHQDLEQLLSGDLQEKMQQTLDALEMAELKLKMQCMQSNEDAVLMHLVWLHDSHRTLCSDYLDAKNWERQLQEFIQ